MWRDLLLVQQQAPVVPLLLPPGVSVSRCVVTDVLPRCFPAEDELRVH